MSSFCKGLCVLRAGRAGKLTSFRRVCLLGCCYFWGERVEAGLLWMTSQRGWQLPPLQSWLSVPLGELPYHTSLPRVVLCPRLLASASSDKRDWSPRLEPTTPIWIKMSYCTMSEISTKLLCVKIGYLDFSGGSVI